MKKEAQAISYEMLMWIVILVVIPLPLGQKQNVLEAIKLGAKSYIIKPIEKEKVIEIIGRVLLQTTK